MNWKQWEKYKQKKEFPHWKIFEWQHIKSINELVIQL